MAANQYVSRVFWKDTTGHEIFNLWTIIREMTIFLIMGITLYFYISYIIRKTNKISSEKSIKKIAFIISIGILVWLLLNKIILVVTI